MCFATITSRKNGRFDAGVEQPSYDHFHVWRFSRPTDGEIADANCGNGEGVFLEPAAVKQGVAASRHAVVE